jgi:general secretion pathway protein M
MKLPQALQARWDEVSAREQRLVLAALALLLVAAFWWLGVAPALGSLRSGGSAWPRH